MSAFNLPSAGLVISQIPIIILFLIRRKPEERVGIFGVLPHKKATLREADADLRRSFSTSQPSLGQPHCDRQ
jgi:hypothetical protein